MTEQYQQRNINNPEGGQSIVNSVGTPDAALSAADSGKSIRFDTTAAAGTITLPSAQEAGDGAEITVIFPAGSTNAATLAAYAGDTLVAPAAAPANPAVTDNACVTVQSDGGTNWYIISGLA